ncbi:hypothetical protein OROGR_002278 [Orobanche gracilis]
MCFSSAKPEVLCSICCCSVWRHEEQALSHPPPLRG